MTRADILRRLAEASGITMKLAEATLAALTALAREPGGAEAVAEVVGLDVRVHPGGWCISRRRCLCVGQIVAVEKTGCPCHAGSVCSDACQRGAHHGGCVAAEKERGT